MNKIKTWFDTLGFRGRFIVYFLGYLIWLPVAALCIIGIGYLIVTYFNIFLIIIFTLIVLFGIFSAAFESAIDYELKQERKK
jgi:CDP-diglyceride synthetase